jgi:hypothetical protein
MEPAELIIDLPNPLGFAIDHQWFTTCDFERTFYRGAQRPKGLGPWPARPLPGSLCLRSPSVASLATT